MQNKLSDIKYMSMTGRTCIQIRNTSDASWDYEFLMGSPEACAWER